jgi:uracil-DNA glycosylase family 4
MVPGEGRTPSPLLLVGEAPGQDEAFRSHRPFTGKAGRELDRYLEIAGVARSSCYVTNLVKCNPPDNRDPTPAEIERCSPLLEEEVGRVNPRVVVTLGAASLEYMSGGRLDIGRVWGIPQRVEGRPLLFPIHHPALGLHQTAAITTITQGFERLGRFLEGEGMEVKDGYPDPSYGFAEGGLYVAPDVVAVDTETCTDGSPLSIQLSWREGEAVVVEAGDTPTIDTCRHLLEDPDTLVVLHNAMFDLEVLHNLNIHPPRFTDTMVMAYLLQDLPQGLKALAYRIAGMEMEEYGEVVREAGLARNLSYLEGVLEFEWEDPPQELRWDKEGNPKVYTPQNISRKVRRTIADVAAGKPVDVADRWRKMVGREEVERVLGVMPGADLRHVGRGRFLRYAARDADATLRVYPYLNRRIREEGLEGVLEADLAMIPLVLQMQRNGILIDRKRFRTLKEEFREKKREMEDAISRMVGYRLNPGSSPQVSHLLFDVLGVKGRRKSSTSTAKENLEPIRHQYPVIDHIMSWREYDKLETSYLDVIPAKAGKDDRIRTNLRITRTVTGRLASSDPNLMAQPVRTAEARRVREGFVARPGWVLASMDYSQIEMRVTADQSQDPTMLEVFRKGLDIHSETASRMFNLPVTALDEMKHRYPAKRTGFGILNLISPQGLLREMQVGGATGWTEEGCESLIREWFRIYAGVKAWIQENEAEARRTGKIRDMWGRYRLVPEIQCSDSRIVEDGVRQACNAPIQMGAQGIIKRAMGELVGVVREWGEDSVKPLLQVHDDILWEIREDLAPILIPVIKSVMEGCARLSIPTPVDAKCGRRWGEMKKWKGDADV